MGKITGNEAAYPMDFSQDGYKMNEGLTIRQYFAKAAMQALISAKPHEIHNAKAGAALALEWADALIAELNKEGGAQ